MGRKLDFDDCTNAYSMKVRRIIRQTAEYILSEGPSLTMRKVSRETGIPRRTLHRYMIEYTKLLDVSYPDFDEYGERIDYDEVMCRVRNLIKQNVIKYQRKR